MLNNKNLFLSALLVSNFALISSLYADNPGEVVAQADDAAEEVVTETQAETAPAPAESSTSVLSRTLSPMPVISAIPPALSATGP